MTLNHGQLPEGGSTDHAYGANDGSKNEEGRLGQTSTSPYYPETNILIAERAREATAIEHNLTVKEAFRLVWE